MGVYCSRRSNTWTSLRRTTGRPLATQRRSGYSPFLQLTFSNGSIPLSYSGWHRPCSVDRSVPALSESTEAFTPISSSASGTGAASDGDRTVENIACLDLLFRSTLSSSSRKTELVVSVLLAVGADSGTGGGMSFTCRATPAPVGGPGGVRGPRWPHRWHDAIEIGESTSQGRSRVELPVRHRVATSRSSCTRSCRAPKLSRKSACAEINPGGGTG